MAVTPDFIALVNAIIAQGETCQSVLVKLDVRPAKTPAGPGRDRLTDFRHELVAKINAAKGN